MSRFRRAIHGVISSYILLAATAVYSLASVPLALHYLDTKRFGLWLVMGTLAGYLNLIDVGMTGATARLLIDHKDERRGGRYGSLIKTGWLVSLLQGMVIFLIGLILAETFARLLLITAELRIEFVQLVNWQCGVMALTFASSIFGLILSAHQRMDWVNYTGVLGLAVNLSTQWVCFHFNSGVLSLAWGSLAGLATAVTCQVFACVGLKLFPDPHGWGRVSWQPFKELFNYGRDMFLVAVGTQLIMASQIIIITRMMGLEAASIWGVGVRVFNLLNQAIWRLYDMSGAAFAEMLARGELARLRDRYRSVAMLTFSLAGWAAVSFALCNSLFIARWTHGKIHWPVMNDCLLAWWMIMLSIVHSYNCFVLLIKQVGFMRYIYFLEGVVFVSLSLLIARHGGLAAIIACSIICTTVFSGTYGIWRISRFFEVSFRQPAFEWLRPMFKVLIFYMPLAGLAWGLSIPASDLTRLAINVLLSGSVGIFLLLRFGIPPSFQGELLRRIPTKAVPFFSRIFH